MIVKRRKHISDAEVGDYLVAGSRLFKVVKLNKTQIICEDGTRFARKSGKRWGGYGYHSSYASILQDETPEEFLARKEEAYQEKEARRLERERQLNEKFASVAKANPQLGRPEYITTLNESLGLQQTWFVNKEGKQFTMLFTVSTEPSWEYKRDSDGNFLRDEDDKLAIYEYEVHRIENCAVWYWEYPDEPDRRRIAMSNPSTARGAEMREALMQVAFIFWDR